MIRYVDFDGVLAKFDKWRGPEHLGEPVPEMVSKVKKWVSEGSRVVIYTARMTPGVEFGQINNIEKTKSAIENWCYDHIGYVLPITNIKSYADVYYDDKCSRIIPNTGLTLEETIARIASQGLNYAPHTALDRILTLLKEVDHDI